MLTLNYYKNRKSRTNIETAKIGFKDIKMTVSATGQTEAEEEVSLKFQTSGKLAWVGVKKGDYVKKWQAIASLDKEELQKNLKKKLLDYMKERWNFEQITLDDYRDMALTETIRRTKEKAQFDLDKSVLDVEIADIALKYATIFTPIEGIVTKIDTPFAGVNVTPTSTEFIISNPNTMVFKAKVDEIDIGKIYLGQKAKVILDAYAEEEIESKVSEIDFSPTITSSGGTAYLVTFPLPQNNSSQKYKLGMNGEVQITIAEIQHTLAVPLDALQTDNQHFYVWVRKDENYEKKWVKTGISDDSYIQILEGLEEGQEVVISGFQNFKK